MTPNCLINGQSDALLSLSDRGLAYGDGVFRTLRVANTVPVDWDLHFGKLSRDCAALGIPCPEAAVLLADIAQLVQGKSPAVVKIVITRGEGQRGYAIQPGTPPTRIVIVSPMPAYPEENFRRGVRLHLCTLRLSHQPRLAGIKHLNRLENVLARSEWQDPKIGEGILLDQQGNAIEGTMSNFFVRFDSRLLTPDLSQCGVAGVTRDRILQSATALGLLPEVSAIPLELLMQADEMIICNSLIGIWQVSGFNGRTWPQDGLAQNLRQLLWN